MADWQCVERRPLRKTDDVAAAETAAISLATGVIAMVSQAGLGSQAAVGNMLKGASYRYDRDARGPAGDPSVICDLDPGFADGGGAFPAGWPGPETWTNYRRFRID